MHCNKQLPFLWHSRVGGGAVHSINTGSRFQCNQPIGSPPSHFTMNYPARAALRRPSVNCSASAGFLNGNRPK